MINRIRTAIFRLAIDFSCKLCKKRLLLQVVCADLDSPFFLIE